MRSALPISSQVLSGYIVLTHCIVSLFNVDQAHYYQPLTISDDDDDQPKLRGSGVVVTLVCVY